jgi:SAM-dependent methyltransferase
MWTGDARVVRVARVVTDLCGGSLAGRRVIDLACDEGNFSTELAARGAAEVIGVEGRARQAIARERAERRGVVNVRFEQGDVRHVTSTTHGSFDVVLCLGILYHLDTPDVFEFARNVVGLTKPGGFALIETNVGLTRPRRETFDARTYWGKSYPEDLARVGASLDNLQSFWPTRTSLFNLLQHVGFTSVLQVTMPVIPVVDQMVDHLLLAAVKGAPAEFDAREAEVWPERLTPGAHPTQGARWRLLERGRALTGRGRMAAIFQPPRD